MRPSQIECMPQTQENYQSIRHQQHIGIIHQANFPYEQQHEIAHQENLYEQYGMVHQDYQYGFGNDGTQRQSFAGGFSGGSFTQWMMRPF